MSQAAYYNGYDDGFIDGKKLGLALGGGPGAPSGPVPVATPTDALVPGALNVIAPTLQDTYNWSPIYLNSDRTFALDQSVDYVQGAPIQNPAAFQYPSVLSERGHMRFSKSEGSGLEGAYLLSNSGSFTAQCTAHITGLDMDPFSGIVNISGSFLSIPVNGGTSMTIIGTLTGNPDEGTLVGMVDGADLGSISVTASISSVDFSKTSQAQDCPAELELGAYDAHVDLAIGRVFSVPSIALGDAPGYRVVLVLPDGSSAVPAFAFTGATVAGTVPTAPGTHVLDLTKTSDGYALSVANA